jgi:hypothetical protein
MRFNFLIKKYSHARVFFLKIHNGRALQDTKKLRNLHGEGDGEIAISSI